MKISWQNLWQLLWSYNNKIPLDQTSKLVRLSRPTVFRWFRLFRENLPKQDDVRLEGIVQMDEAYFGGKKKGYAVIGAKEQGSSKIAAMVIAASSVQRADITPFLRQHVVPGSKLYSDGAAIYKGIGRYWPVEHAYDIHKKGEFGKTSVIEGFWGSFRTYIRRMYHHVTLKYLEKILIEYQCRLMQPEIFASPASFLTKTLITVSFA